MSRIAERGVRFSQFHATVLCSPIRASLLTRRNAPIVGMAVKRWNVLPAMLSTPAYTIR